MINQENQLIKNYLLLSCKKVNINLMNLMLLLNYHFLIFLVCFLILEELFHHKFNSKIICFSECQLIQFLADFYYLDIFQLIKFLIFI